jgi:hypothetical protein
MIVEHGEHRVEPARLHDVSLLRNSSTSPRASSAARLQLPMKAEVFALRSKRTPVTCGNAAARSSGRASSCTSTS